MTWFNFLMVGTDLDGWVKTIPRIELISWDLSMLVNPEHIFS